MAVNDAAGQKQGGSLAEQLAKAQEAAGKLVQGGDEQVQQQEVPGAVPHGGADGRGVVGDQVPGALGGGAVGSQQEGGVVHGPLWWSCELACLSKGSWPMGPRGVRVSSRVSRRDRGPWSLLVVV